MLADVWGTVGEFGPALNRLAAIVGGSVGAGREVVQSEDAPFSPSSQIGSTA